LRVDGAEVPRTREEIAALEAQYRPFEAAAAWSGVVVDADRWRRHAEGLREVVGEADPGAWQQVRDGFMRAAALDSSALAQLIRPVPTVTTVVLSGSLSEAAWASAVDAAGDVVECHRRALVIAADAAEDGRPLDEHAIARLQDLIVESQRTYTVTTDGSDRQEADLPRRQYKAMSNFLMRTDRQLVPFAPASEVESEMARLSAELTSDAFAGLHPVVQAAYSHVALIRIHPFADGNGRLARTLACMPLLREVGLPQLILADQWPAYLGALLRSDDGDPQGIVELFLAAQINSMDLARSLLDTDRGGSGAVPVAPDADPAERMLMDLVSVHLREAIGAPDADRRVSVTRGVSERDAIGVVIAGSDSGPDANIEFTVQPDDGRGWLRLVSTAGDALEVSRNDVDPAPLEIAHLRVRSWLDASLRRGGFGLTEATPVRGLFVLGAPRSGTTLVGNWLGSHPEVLRLAEYGGFYIADSVAPAYLSRLPGGEHETFLRELRHLAADHVSRAARHQGCSWFCDATPWNVEVAAAIGSALPDAVFVLMLRHFSGAVQSLHRFPWAGETVEDAARLWVELNACIDQLPEERTLAIGYDVLAADPAAAVEAMREVMLAIGLDPDQFDDTQFALSHAHIVGEPRPTVAHVADGRAVFHPIPSLDAVQWTPEVHAAVWPVVAEAHRALLSRFPGVYEPPPRPDHVPPDEW
jgi:hypothetical protein